MLRVVAIVVLLFACALPARAEPPPEPVAEHMACGPGGAWLANFGVSLLATAPGVFLAENAGAAAEPAIFTAWGSFVAPLVTMPINVWLSKGRTDLLSTLGWSMAARLLVLVPLVFIDAASERFESDHLFFVGTVLASVVGASVETAREYLMPPPQPGRGPGLRLGATWESSIGAGSGLGGVVEYVHLGRGKFSQGGFSAALSGWVRPPWTTPAATNLAFDAAYRREWHPRPSPEPGFFGAFLAGGGLAFGCIDRGCSPVRVLVGAEVGWRFPFDDRFRLESVLQTRARRVVGGNGLEWQTAFLLGLQ